MHLICFIHFAVESFLCFSIDLVCLVYRLDLHSHFSLCTHKLILAHTHIYIYICIYIFLISDFLLSCPAKAQAQSRFLIFYLFYFFFACNLFILYYFCRWFSNRAHKSRTTTTTWPMRLWCFISLFFISYFCFCFFFTFGYFHISF